MHSFCISIPYGALVALGGFIGFLLKGSSTSLMMGLLFGGVTAGLGYSALQKFHSNVSDAMEIMAGLAVSVVLSIVMCMRWQSTGKVMPAGLVGVISIAMSVFYVYRLMNPTLPKKGGKGH